MRNTLIVTRQQLKKCHSDGSTVTNTKDSTIQINIKPIIYVLTQMIMTGSEEE